MKVKTLGKKETPAVLMIPGMFCTSDMPETSARLLSDDFFFILPTLDGHHKEETVYHSVETDGRKISEWLRENGVRHLALLQGTSMGAEVALQTARQLDIPVDHYLFDGGPFFHFPRFFRAIMAEKFMSYMKKVKGKDPDAAVSELMRDPFVKKLGGKSLDAYRGLFGGFCEVSRWIEKDSVRRIVDTCYKCDLPGFDKETQRRFIFLFSEKEPARRSETRLKKQYPEASFLVARGYGHGGFQAADPEKYARLLRDITEGNVDGSAVI